LRKEDASFLAETGRSRALGNTMSTITAAQRQPEIEYPDSDGQPMAENTVQFEYIVTIEGGLDAMYADAEVFVAGDLFWYPVEGEPTIRTAPDVLVAFGRPKGHRGSYKQWLEGNIAPQTVFEVWSPGNRSWEMREKFQFYERYGVEEYYLYDPDRGHLKGWLRRGAELLPIKRMNGWTSPRLGIHFKLVSGELQLFRPDGGRFLTYVELEQARELAQSLAVQERRQREEAQATIERLAAQLRALGKKPEL
jgi:Uma2 family endonuclease